MTFELLTLGQFTVALLMSLAALCAFFWAFASGALADVERTKYQVLRAETENMGGSGRPTACSSEGGYAPLGLPRPSLGAPRRSRGAIRQRDSFTGSEPSESGESAQ